MNRLFLLRLFVRLISERQMLLKFSFTLQLFN